MKEEMNPIEIAIAGGENALEEYLGGVTNKDFIEHIQDLKRRYADKDAIKQAITELQKLLPCPSL